jgi:hypothetical protein
MKFFEGWMKRWQERNAHAVGYRFGDAPTADEVAAQAAEHARWSEREREIEDAQRAASISTQSGEYARWLEREDAQRKLRAVAWAELTVAQVARLSELIEECGEVVQAAAKVLQGGYSEASRHGKGMSRRILLERELGHLSAAVETMYAAGDVRLHDVRTWQQRRCGVRSAPAAAAPTSQRERGAGQ